MDAHLLLVFVYIYILGYNKSETKECDGLESSSLSHNAERRYKQYSNGYTNCTVIVGNLELDDLKNSLFDMSFLSSIREVTGYVKVSYYHPNHLPLNNLVLIRGKQLYRGRYSLYLIHNAGLKEIHLTSLGEILKGRVRFHNNNLLCYEDMIHWTEIFQDASKQNVTNDVIAKNDNCKSELCHPSCAFNNVSYCWGPGPEMCQKFSKLNCKEICGENARCFSNGLECCDAECAGGCTGIGDTHCLTCRNVNNSGECLKQCPSLHIYEDNLNKKTTKNPDGRYQYGNSCVQKCPAHMHTDGKFCVGESKPNLTKCDGASLNKNNIAQFVGCEYILGHISIVETTFTGDNGMNISSLSALESIQIIQDYLYIQNSPESVTSLSFLRNLKVILGQKLEGSDALIIHKTGITSLGLESLRSIKKGNIYIGSNTNLCYITYLNWTNFLWSSDQTVTSISNKNSTICSEEGHVCSSQCSNEGCWHSGNDGCLSCLNFKYNGTCIESCDNNTLNLDNNTINLFQSGPDTCERCHEECATGCKGKKDDECVGQCLHYNNSNRCVLICPPGKYEHDEDMTCQLCHSNCKECSGPGDYLNSSGCDSCKYQGIDDDGYKLCTNLTSCEEGYYESTNQICMKCDPLCKSCTAKSLNKDWCVCKYYEDMTGKCVQNCSAGDFADENTCRECHPVCKECTGPEAFDCTVCKNYKVFTGRGISEFNCTDKCPQDARRERTEKEDICFPYEPRMGASTKQSSKSNALYPVLGVISAFVGLFIVFIVVYKRIKKNKKVTVTLREVDDTTNNIEMLPVTPTSAKPDMAVLRFISENHIKRVSEVGSGAFGTVYQGFWFPEGKQVKIPIAIKVLNEDTTTAQNQELLEEARLMASVDSKYCVPVIGVSLASQMMMITPFMPHGCLLDYVRKNTKNINSKVFLEWSRQIAKGMCYLEERGIVHRDLAARNVLVNSPNLVRVTDFGMSKLLDIHESEYKTKCGKMPIKWLALESLQHGIFTSKSDVWSFGVTLWEIFTYGEKPYANYNAMEIPTLLESGERLQQPSICTIDVYMLMIKCWMIDADSRPCFTDLATEFSKMSQDPGRYLVIKGDRLMRLPSQNDETKDILYKSMSWAGPEQLIEADRYLTTRNIWDIDATQVSECKVNMDTKDSEQQGGIRYVQNGPLCKLNKDNDCQWEKDYLTPRSSLSDEIGKHQAVSVKGNMQVRYVANPPLLRRRRLSEEEITKHSNNELENSKEIPSDELQFNLLQESEEMKLAKKESERTSALQKMLVERGAVLPTVDEEDYLRPRESLSAPENPQERLSLFDGTTTYYNYFGEEEELLLPNVHNSTSSTTSFIEKYCIVNEPTSSTDQNTLKSTNSRNGLEDDVFE